MDWVHVLFRIEADSQVNSSFCSTKGDDLLQVAVFQALLIGCVFMDEFFL